MHEFFEVHTPSGLQVGVNAQGQLVATTAPPRPAWLGVRADIPALAFMLAPATQAGGADSFAIDGVAFRTAMQPWRIRRHAGSVVLFDPILGHVLAETQPGVLALQVSDNLAGSALRLSGLPKDAPVRGVLDRQMALLAAVLPANLNGPDMLDSILAALTTDTADAAQAVLRVLPQDQIRWLAGSILGLPAHLARFAAAYPADIWATEALPALREWCLTRQAPRQLHLPPSLDFLADAGISGYPTTVAHMVNGMARASVPPRHAVCVVATARNEGLYLLEWIAYHRLVGAGAIFLYSNDNSDGSNDLLRQLALAGEITWIDSQLEVGRGAQPKAYGHAFGVMPGVLDYRWSLVIDLDEFFAFDTQRFRSLPDYIAWQEAQRVDAIALSWVVFGSAGAARWDGKPMMERFTKRFPWVDMHIKSISRTNQIIHSFPHHGSFTPMATPLTRDCDGLVFASSGGSSFAAQPKAQTAWIAHYFVKSAEEFIWKFSRNRGDHALVRESDPKLIDPTLISMFVEQHRSPTMMDDDRVRACAPNLAAEIARLRQLPGVEVALQRVHATYRAGIGGLLDTMGRMERFTGQGTQQAALVKAALE